MERKQIKRSVMAGLTALAMSFSPSVDADGGAVLFDLLGLSSKGPKGAAASRAVANQIRQNERNKAIEKSGTEVNVYNGNNDGKHFSNDYAGSILEARTDYAVERIIDGKTHSWIAVYKDVNLDGKRDTSEKELGKLRSGEMYRVEIISLNYPIGTNVSIAVIDSEGEKDSESKSKVVKSPLGLYSCDLYFEPGKEGLWEIEGRIEGVSVSNYFFRVKEKL